MQKFFDMFDTGKSKFYKKTKSLLKLLKPRLEAIKKKRSAVNKYLKNDVADLLRNGLDTNAYGRAEGLLVEQNMSSCYDFVEQCILCIYSQLSNMENQRECPSECREAVPSLMHAAARFADLPELRDLRTLFTERYGNSLEPYINKEFVEKLRSGPPSQEMKFRLMQEVAQEYCIQWDSEAFQMKLFKTQAPAQVPAQVPAQGKPMHGPFYGTGVDAYNWQKRKDDTFRASDSPYKGNKQSDVKGYNVPTSYGKKDATYDRYNVPSSSEDEMVTNYIRDSTSQDSQQTGSSTVGSFSEDEVDSRKPSFYGFIQPPYVKQTAAKEGSTLAANGHVNSEQNNGQDAPAWKGTLKPPPGREMVANGRKEHKISPRLQSILNSDDVDESDEDEKKLDQLLMRYSKKKASHESSRNTNVYPPGQESDYASDGSTSYRSARATFYPPPGQESDESYGATRHRSARANVYPPPGQESDDTASDGSSSHRSGRGNIYPPPGQEGDDSYGATRHRRTNLYPPPGQESDDKIEATNYRTHLYPPLGQESADAHGATRHRSAIANVYPPAQQSDDIYGAKSHRNARANVYPPPIQESDDPYGGTRHRSARTDPYPPPGQENDDPYGASWHRSARTNLYPPPEKQSDVPYGAASHRSVRTNVYPPPGQENDDAYEATRHRSVGTNLYPPPGQENDDAYGATRHRSVRTNLYPPPGQESEDTNGATWHRSSRAQYPSAGQESHDSYGAVWNRSSRGNLYPPGQQIDNTRGARHISSKSELPVTPERETTFQPTAPYGATRTHARTNSNQEMTGGHVHPKLPDYDDLAARLGALRGR